MKFDTVWYKTVLYCIHNTYCWKTMFTQQSTITQVYQKQRTSKLKISKQHIVQGKHHTCTCLLHNAKIHPTSSYIIKSGFSLKSQDQNSGLFQDLRWWKISAYFCTVLGLDLWIRWQNKTMWNYIQYDLFVHSNNYCNRLIKHHCWQTRM